MRVLHLFPEYLPLTMAWAHTLLTQVPQVTTHIAGLQYLPNDVASDGFSFWPHPSDNLPPLLRPTAHKLFWKTNVYHRALKRYIQAHKIELLHLHFGPTGADFAALGPACRIPVVVSFYGFDYQRILIHKPAYRARYQRMFSSVDVVTGEGPYACRTLAQLGCPPEKIHLLPLGVDAPSIPFQVRQKEAGQLKLVQIAAIAPYKGQLLAVEAFRAAYTQCPGIRLDFYGPERDPAFARIVRQRIADYQLQEVISVFPALPINQLHQTLHEYHAFIHPSQHTTSGDREGGAPVVLLDAMATGLPILSTLHCDIPFVVEHQKTGLLCPEGDVRCMQEAILYFAHLPPQAYTSYAEAARNQVSQAHAAGQSRQLLSNLYAHLLNN